MAIHAPDRETFLAKRPAGTAIRVVRMSTSVLKRRPNFGLAPFPAVQFTYSFYNGVTDTEWIFNETLVAANPRGGFVDFAGTLWDELAHGRLGPYEFIQRSGSF